MKTILFLVFLTLSAIVVVQHQQIIALENTYGENFGEIRSLREELRQTKNQLHDVDWGYHKDYLKCMDKAKVAGIL